MKKALFLLAFIFMNLYSDLGFSQFDPTLGLAAWYPLNQNPNNAMGNGSNCVNDGATLTTDRFGNPNSAYYFDGSSFLVGDFNTVGYTAMTFSAWIKTSYASNYEVLLQVTGDVCYINRFTPGHFMAAMDAASGNNPSTDESSSFIADGSWRFVASTNDGSITKIYVNGNLENTYPESLWTLNSKIEIAGDIGNTTTRFHGSIDDVRIYKKVLNDNEIKAVYKLPDNHDTFAYNEDSLNFIIYPNPSNGLFKISTGNLKVDASITVYDCLGRLILNDSFNGKSKQMDLSYVAPGIYFITLSTQNATLTKKLDLITMRW